MPVDIHKSRKSKHSLITEAISAQIEGGKYRTGDLLPSESELGKAFGVSRHTVRAALRNLAAVGLVTSHQGIGTQIQAEKVTSRYNFAVNSVSDLHQYAAQTVVHLLDIKEIVADSKLAKYLGCKKSEHWWQIRTMRSERIGGTVGAYSEIFVPSAFGAAIRQIRKNTSRTVFSHLEEYLNETVAEIRQEIAAVSLTAEEARHLQVRRNSPALEITRRYLRKNQDVFEIARVVHPASLFKYSMQVRLQHS